MKIYTGCKVYDHNDQPQLSGVEVGITEDRVWIGKCSYPRSSLKVKLTKNLIEGDSWSVTLGKRSKDSEDMPHEKILAHVGAVRVSTTESLHRSYYVKYELPDKRQVILRFSDHKGYLCFKWNGSGKIPVVDSGTTIDMKRYESAVKLIAVFCGFEPHVVRNLRLSLKKDLKSLLGSST